jgi:hypothetical protein
MPDSPSRLPKGCSSLTVPRLPISGPTNGHLDPGRGFDGGFGSQSDSQHPSQLPAGFLEDSQPWGMRENHALQFPRGTLGNRTLDTQDSEAGALPFWGPVGNAARVSRNDAHLNPASAHAMPAPVNSTTPIDGRIVAASWADGDVRMCQFRLGGGSTRLEVLPNLDVGDRNQRRVGTDGACHLRATPVGIPQGHPGGLEVGHGGRARGRGLAVPQVEEGVLGRGEADDPSGRGYGGGDAEHRVDAEGLGKPLFSWVPHLSLAPIGVHPVRRVCQPLGALPEPPGEEEPRRLCMYCFVPLRPGALPHPLRMHSVDVKHGPYAIRVTLPYNRSLVVSIE